MLGFAQGKVNELLAGKPKFRGLLNSAAKNSISVKAIDIHDNYTSAILHQKDYFYIGYAKRNPNCDGADDERGVTIACSKALSRILDADSLELTF